MPARKLIHASAKIARKTRKMNLRLAYAALICLAPLAGSLDLAQAQSAMATLTITVDNVSPKGGDIRLSLYDRAGYDGRDGKAIVDMVVSATSPSTQMVLPPLPPGTYAIKMFQDYNRNEEFDFTWIGLPAEGYGFSNNVKPLFSEPGFDKTQFTLSAGNQTISLTMQ